MAIQSLHKKRKECYFKVNNIDYIDYKDMALLKRFMSSYSKIVTRKRTGTSARFQRQLNTAIKRSRYMGLIPYIRR